MLQKVFGFILVVSFLLALPLYGGFYPLKPKSIYEKAIIGTILPAAEENTTSVELPKDLPILIGVFMVDGMKKAIFYLPKEREKKAIVEEGKEFKGFLLKKVDKGRVVLEKKGREYVITLFSQESKNTRNKRRRVVYIPPTRKVVEGVEKVPSSLPLQGVSPSPKASSTHVVSKTKKSPVKKKEKSRKPTTKKAKSFIELLKSLSRKAREGGNVPKENPFLKLFQKR